MDDDAGGACNPPVDSVATYMSPNRASDANIHAPLPLGARAELPPAPTFPPLDSPPEAGAEVRRAVLIAGDSLQKRTIKVTSSYS